MVERIFLDPELIELLNSPEGRKECINALLNGGYFSEDEFHNLVAKIKTLEDSFVYEEHLIEDMRHEFSMEPLEAVVDLEQSRNPAFRRLILSAYQETCTVCGIRLMTSSGISIIDASHILPFAQFHIDDLRNGLSSRYGDMAPVHSSSGEPNRTLSHSWVNSNHAAGVRGLSPDFPRCAFGPI